MSDHKHILLATLGGQPQIVTFTLDLLLQKGFPMTEVIVLHPGAAQPRLQHALARLRAEFVGDCYQAANRIIHFHSQVLQLDGKPIDDITDDLHADGTLDTIHRLIGDVKRQGYRIHLSVSGGRRLMALLAISVASFNFDRHDHIWHLYTPDGIREQAREGKMMHVTPDAGVTLIQGQFISLGAYVYDPTRSFRVAQQERRSQIEAQQRELCARVAKEASPGQLKVLQAFSRGLRPQQVAEELGIGLTTVQSHRTVLLRLCYNAWNIDAAERLDYRFLQTTFADYFAANEGPGG